MLGVFDSGVGGLTVVKEIRRLLPNTSIIYAGDTARAPYGGKDAQTLFEHGREIIRFLLKEGAEAIVVACGTSSSVVLEPLRREFTGINITDTIRPAVEATLQMSQKNKDFKPVFAATEATVKSGVFAKLFSEKTDIKLYVRACPLFAPMVEAGYHQNNPLINFAAEHYFSDLRGKVNALILGCTHYPLVTDALTHALGEVTFINPATATAQAIILPKEKCTVVRTKYYTSGDPKIFSEKARIILGENCIAKKASFI